MNIVSSAKQYMTKAIAAIIAIAAMIKRAVLNLKKEKGKRLVIACQGEPFTIDGNNPDFLEFFKAISDGQCSRKLKCSIFLVRMIANGAKKCWELHECSCFLKKLEQCNFCQVKKKGKSLC